MEKSGSPEDEVTVRHAASVAIRVTIWSNRTPRGCRATPRTYRKRAAWLAYPVDPVDPVYRVFAYLGALRRCNWCLDTRPGSLVSCMTRPAHMTGQVISRWVTLGWELRWGREPVGRVTVGAGRGGAVACRILLEIKRPAISLFHGVWDQKEISGEGVLFVARRTWQFRLGCDGRLREGTLQVLNA